MHSSTPRQLGYRMPAEWEPHQSTWISWPHNTETWPDELEQVETTIARAVRALSLSEPVRINVSSAAQKVRAQRALESAGVSGNVRFHDVPTNDAWVRDYGPIFVVGRSGKLAATTWRFNSWGEKYPPYDQDAAAAARMVRELDVPSFDADMVLEGGSIDVNGSGLLITTKSCLLNSNRNPNLTSTDVESILSDYLGIDEVIWLDRGIEGDDTDGHIDDFARFVAEHTVLVATEHDRSSPNFEALSDARERLAEFTSREGERLDVLELPMPSAVVIRGEHMPASYANFYVGNRTVLVPIFDDPNDKEALSTLRRCFPTREVVGISCRELIWGLGAFHCLTQQVPHGR